MITTEQLREHLGKALEKSLNTLRLYTYHKLSNVDGNRWHILFRDALSPGMQKQWEQRIKEGTKPEDAIEFHYLSRFVQNRRNFFEEDFGRKVWNVPTWLSEVQDVRNKFAHIQTIEEDEALRALNNLILIFKHLGMSELEQEIMDIREEIRIATLPKEFKQSLQPKKEEDKPVYKGPLIPWFKNVMPHLDIQRGHLDESVFAANLGEVATGGGREVYRNPSTFFSKTYFTAGLKTIAKRVITGLNGEQDAENRVISLQTGFGGGKTHALISLFHIAKMGKSTAESNDLRALLHYAGMPKFDSANIAVFTNTTNDPTQGRKVDGLHIRTMWGELAYQLGGKAAYEQIRANDENLTAPAGLFRKILEDTKPALILVDELADYCVKASGKTVGGSTLSDQTVSFIQELSEAVAGANHCVLVATLPASESEVANSPQAAQILHSLSNRLSRVGKDTKPVEDDEIFEVIRWRLFEDLGDEKEIEKVVSQYAQLYEGLVIYDEIPSYAAKTSFKELLRKSYPFHPELINMFRVRWASNHDFQRTRGVLRLLASIVSDLWKRQSSLTGNVALIHTSDINFTNLDALSSQLKKLYGNGYEAVISADVSGGSSNSFKIDQDKKEYGMYGLTQGIASTILMGSFGSSGANRGLSMQDIKLCVLRPDSFNHNNVNGALDAMENRAHYLYYSTVGTTSKRYWFHTQPNINILINQAKNEDINEADIHAEVITRINTQANRSTRFNVIVDPASEIPEQKKPTLIFLHPKYQANPKGANGNVKPAIQRIATKKGNAERIYRNTILFLVCSELGFGELKRNITELLACRKVEEDYRSQLDPDQRRELKSKIEEADNLSNQALVTAYSIILKWKANEAEHLLARQFRNTLDQQLSTNIFGLLKDEEWLLESVGLRLLGRYNLLPEPGKPKRAKDIYEAFIRYDNFPMVTGPEAVQESLRRYCYDDELAIASGDGEQFTKYYFGEQVPFFDVTDESYWIVAREDVPAPQEERGGEAPMPIPPVGGDRPGQPTARPEPASPEETAKTFRSITISGQVDVANYHQVFTSFINPLRNNNVEIEITIRGKSTEANPITENSQQYKITKESAGQLGLGFETEPEE